MKYKLITAVIVYDGFIFNARLMKAKEDLEKQLTYYIKKGWTTQGGIAMSITNNNIVLAQAVIR